MSPTAPPPILTRKPVLELPARPSLQPLPAAFECDLSDDSLRWSPGVFALFGIAPGTRLDRREVLAMYRDDSREMLERLRARAIAERGSFTLDACITRIDGGERRIRIVADTHVRAGKTRYLYGTKIEVTPLSCRG